MVILIILLDIDIFQKINASLFWSIDDFYLTIATLFFIFLISW
jgi:hypothetical protein